MMDKFECLPVAISLLSQADQQEMLTASVKYLTNALSGWSQKMFCLFG